MNDGQITTNKKQKKTGASVQLKRAGLFKGLLFIGAFVLVGALFFMSHQIVMMIRDSSRSHLSLSVRYYKNLLESDNPELALSAVEEIKFPVIITDSEGNPKFWKNIGSVQSEFLSEITDEELETLHDLVHQMDAAGNIPESIEIYPGEFDYFHYGDPDLVRLLQIYTILSAIVVSIYVLLGYVGFKTIRKAEERSVWVGMARETAHQLGTPISSLMGWLEVIDTPKNDAILRMKQDVARLERIAIRFSKIGTREKLKEHSLVQIVDEAIYYMRTRVGSGIDISLNADADPVLHLQPDLISWVLENLIRNAAQAMEGEGKINIHIGIEKHGAYIDVKDFGVGISPRNFETIFRPGFTTKKRGWGLGLSLGRRIVVEMHRGRLYVKESHPGEGTTIRMVLPQ